jgi:hypothetical protein
MADRIFRITISGHGGEFAFSKSSLDEYMYWNSDEARLILEDEEDGNPLMEYILNKGYEDEDSTRFDNVKFKREGEWYEQDDIDHNCGANFDYSYLTVTEVADTEWEADVIDTLFDYVSLGEVVYDNELEIEYNEEDYEGHSHVLACVSIEKGVFFESHVYTNGEDFDITKLKFGTKSYITEDEIVEYVYYDGVQLEGEDIDTIGKGMYVEIHEV